MLWHSIMMTLGEESKCPLPNLIVLTGSAHPVLGKAVARELGLRLGRCRTERTPDGELHVEIDDHEVEGQDVAIVQPTSHEGSQPLLELLLIADACRGVGAGAIFAVVPYFAYARQDARKRPGKPLGVRVAARILTTVPFDRLVTVDPHSDVLAASLDVPMDSLSAVRVLVDRLAADLPTREVVVVAPDLGAVGLAREYAHHLRSPLVVVHKIRTSRADVAVERIAGDVRGLRPILIDDMICTGATVVAAARAVREAGSQSGISVAATHAVLTPGVMDRLREAGIERLYLTDSIAPSVPDPEVTIVSIAPLLAACIRRVSTRKRMAHLVLHP